MSLRSIKDISFENCEGEKINVVVWKSEDTDEISLEIENEETMDGVTIGNVNDVRQLRGVLANLIKFMDEEEGSV